MKLLSRIWYHLEIWRRERETISELSHLSERELADIGFTTSQIRDVARLVAREGSQDPMRFGVEGISPADGLPRSAAAPTAVASQAA